MPNRVFIPLLIILIALCFVVDAKANGDHRFSPGFFAMCDLGKIDGCKPFRKFGLNPDIDTSTTPEDAWLGGGQYPFQTSATTIGFSSDDSDDDAGGTGARQIRIEGVDGDYAEITEDLAITGATVSTTSNSFLHINTAYVIDSGTSQGNEGTIAGRTGAYVTVAVLNASSARTEQYVAVIPAGKKWLVDTLQPSILKKNTGNVTYEFAVQQFGTNTWTTLFVSGLSAGGSSSTQYTPGHSRYFVVPSKAKVKLKIRNVSSNNTEFSVDSGGYLVDNDIKL